MHICVSNLTITGPDNGLSPGQRQAIIWTNTGILLIGPLGTNFSEILIEINTFSSKKMRLKMLSAKWRPLCLGLNELRKVSHWNRKVVRVTAQIITGDVEVCLQCLQWQPGQSSWWPFHFSASIYTVEQLPPMACYKLGLCLLISRHKLHRCVPNCMIWCIL